MKDMQQKVKEIKESLKEWESESGKKINSMTPEDIILTVLGIIYKSNEERDEKVDSQITILYQRTGEMMK